MARECYFTRRTACVKRRSGSAVGSHRTSAGEILDPDGLREIASAKCVRNANTLIGRRGARIFKCRNRPLSDDGSASFRSFKGGQADVQCAASRCGGLILAPCQTASFTPVISSLRNQRRSASSGSTAQGRTPVSTCPVPWRLNSGMTEAMSQSRQ